MRSLLWSSLFLLLGRQITCQVVPIVPRPTWSVLIPGGSGIRAWVPDQPDLIEVHLHFNLDRPIPGLDAGDYHLDAYGPTGSNNEWIMEDAAIPAVDGGPVYYWILIVTATGGYQMTEQEDVIGEGSGSPATTAAPITTTTRTTVTTSRTTTPTRSTVTTTRRTTVPGETTVAPGIVSVTESSDGRLYAPGELIFEDEFDFLDLDVWQPEITLAGGGNWEFEAYVNNRSTSYTRDSILYLKPLLTADIYGEEFVRNGRWELWGGSPPDLCTNNGFFGCERTGGGGGNILNPITSARLRSSRGFSFVYGKLEVRAKVPLGDWIWPAIWMLPAKVAYGQWPASGEIDIMESRGNRDYTMDGVNIGVEQVGSTLHFSGGGPLNGWPMAHGDIQNAEGWHADYHNYQLEWTPDFIRISVDDQEILRTEPPATGGFWELGGWTDTDMVNPWRYARNQKMAPFDEQFFLVLNVAVGGIAYFSDDATNAGGKPWNNLSPTAATEFWDARAQWHPTWNPTENNGEDAAMKVDYVRIWASDVVRP